MNRRAFLGGVVATAAATALIPVPKPARRAVTSPAQDQPILWPILYGRISDFDFDYLPDAPATLPA